MTDKEKRKHNPDWNDRTRTARSTKRREELRARLALFGWKNEYDLLTFILKGYVEPPRKPGS